MAVVAQHAALALVDLAAADLQLSLLPLVLVPERQVAGLGHVGAVAPRLVLRKPARAVVVRFPRLANYLYTFLDRNGGFLGGIQVFSVVHELLGDVELVGLLGRKTGFHLFNQ